MYYIISGWDNKGNQIVETHKALSETQACAMFISSIGGGEVNEILDTITDEEYEAEMRKDAGKENDIMTTEENTNMNANEIIAKANANTSRKRRAIKCIENGKTYISIAEAAREMKLRSQNIQHVLHGNRSHTGGYSFIYLTEEETKELFASMPAKEVTIQKPAKMIAKGKRCNGNTNAVLCISTGQVFTSCSDAAEQNDVHIANMSNVCRGVQKTAKGKKFCYVKDINEHLDEVAESIRKANMYDELMTKEEKRKELLNEVNQHKANIFTIESEIAKLHEELKHEHAELEKAKDNLMYFN